MTEPNNQLENELSRMPPRPIDAELVGRIQAAIDQIDTRSWSDRLLIGAICAGSLAACVIGVMLAMPADLSIPDIRPTQVTAQIPSIGSYTRALARADSNWIDPEN